MYKTLGEAWYNILKNDEGLKCPFGCSGCSVRMFGLVKHLMEKHNISEKRAWKMAQKEAS